MLVVSVLKKFNLRKFSQSSFFLNFIFPFYLYKLNKWLPYVPEIEPVINDWKFCAFFCMFLQKPRACVIFLFYWDPEYLQQFACYLNSDIYGHNFWIVVLLFPHVVRCYMAIAFSGSVLRGRNIKLFMLVSTALIDQIYELNFLRQSRNWIKLPLSVLFYLILIPLCCFLVLQLPFPFNYIPYSLMILLPVVKMLSSLDLLYVLMTCMIGIEGNSSADVMSKISEFVKGWINECKIFDEYSIWVAQMISRFLYIVEGGFPRVDNTLPDFKLTLTEEQQSKVPSYLTCTVCKEFIIVPVITPSGNSYCKSCCEELLKSGILKDPLSGKAINDLSLYFNRALYVSSLAWLDSHQISYSTSSAIIKCDEST